MSKKLSSNQKAFNKAVKFLLKQNKKSVQDGTCLYRGPNKTRCGAGALIPDRLYEEDMEGKACDNCYIVANALQSCGYDVDFVRDIQRIHDGYGPSEWRKQFEMLAEKEGLKWPVGV